MRIEEQKKQKITLTYDDYIRFARLIVQYFKTEERAGNAVNGIKQKDVVDWFVEQNMADIVDVEQADRIGKVAHSIIQRLITQEKTLIVIRDDQDDFRERILQLHPNHADH